MNIEKKERKQRVEKPRTLYLTKEVDFFKKCVRCLKLVNIAEYTRTAPYKDIPHAWYTHRKCNTCRSECKRIRYKELKGENVSKDNLKK
jgi:hypothetical protein